MFLWQCYPTVLNVEVCVRNQMGGRGGDFAIGSVVVNHHVLFKIIVLVYLHQV